MDTIKPHVTFLFGAGASAFVEGCTPACPPVGRRLCQAMIDSGYWPTEVSGPIVDEFRSNFEIGMAKLADQSWSSEFVPLLRQMAKYFAQFTVGPKNLYTKLYVDLPYRAIDLSMASLNYETLLEQAMAPYGVDPADVIKPHGSIGFLLNTGGVPIKASWKDSSKNGEGAIEGSWSVVIEGNLILKWLDVNSYFAPAMSLFAEGKRNVFCNQSIQNERSRWRSALESSHTCFVIGVECLQQDSHIWGPLHGASCRLIFVNPSDAGFSAWNATRKKCGRRWPVTFREAVPRIIRECHRIAGSGTPS